MRYVVCFSQRVFSLILKSKVTFLFFVILIIFSLSCNRSNPVNPPNPPCGGIDPLIVSHPPYDSPIWHPSGQFIGFNHTPLRRITYPYGEGCWGRQEFVFDSAGFWLINPDGTNKRRIFPYRLQSPAWSPDGEWIAFSMSIGSDVHIFKMRFTGTTFDMTTLMQLTTEGRNFFPAWSPDGQWIAYDNTNCGSALEPPPPNSCGILIMRADGTEKRFVGGGRMPAWAPNANRLAYIGWFDSTRGGIIEFNLLTGSRTLLLDAGRTHTSHPRYSPDGTKIAFWSDGNLWVMDATGSNLRQLTTRGVDATFGLPFSWSPDGKSIVYTDYRSDDWTYANGVLWIVNIETGMKRQLTFNPH